jgi:probable HAF family extracellular repeat protein
LQKGTRTMLQTASVWQRLAAFIGTTVFFWGTCVSAAPPTHYTLTDLGPTAAMSLDDLRTVVGSSFAPEQQASILFPTAQALTTLGGRADSIRAGRIVGHAQFLLSGTPEAGFFGTHAFVWTAQGGIRDLGTAGAPDLFSAATAVNTSGLIVGYAEEPTTRDSRPCFWHNAALHFLPTLGGPSGFAEAVNALGWIVGQSQTRQGDYHATLWVMGMPLDLDKSGGVYSLARGITTSGIIVGEATFAGGIHAFLWSPGRGMQDLGTLPGHSSSTATSINDASVVVGNSTGNGPFPPPQRAVRWADGQIVDLTTLVEAPGWVLEWASAINQAGAIVGQGQYQGEKRAFLLQPETVVASRSPARLAELVQAARTQHRR